MKDFQITMYGIMHKKDGKLLGFYTEAVGDEDSATISFKLEKFWKLGQRIWTVETFEKAEAARKTNTPWYNAEYETPENPFEPKELKTVRIEINVTDCK